MHDTQEEDLFGTLRAPGFILFSATSAALHCHRHGNMNNYNLLGISDNTWRFQDVQQRCCPAVSLHLPLPFSLLSRPLLTSLSLHLCLVDSHSHRSVPKPRSRVWGHESNHNGREPWCGQHCQRSVWKPDMRVLWVRLSSCNLYPIKKKNSLHDRTFVSHRLFMEKRFLLRWNQSTCFDFFFFFYNCHLHWVVKKKCKVKSNGNHFFAFA